MFRASLCLAVFFYLANRERWYSRQVLGAEHSTPVEPFGISRLYLNCLISSLLTVTFQVDCNIYTDAAFKRRARHITVWNKHQSESVSTTNLDKMQQSISIQLSPHATWNNRSSALHIKTHKHIRDDQDVTDLLSISGLRCASLLLCTCAKHARCESSTTHKHLWNYLWHTKEIFWRITSTIIYRCPGNFSSA